MKNLMIQNRAGLNVRNLESLPRGTGARYLECITTHHDDSILIAKQWRRKPPASFEVLVCFSSR